MLAARVEGQSDKFDWNLVKPPVSQIKGGSKVRLTIYWHVNNAPKNYPYHAVFALTDNGRTVATNSYDGSLGTDPVQTWGTWWKTSLPTSNGNYRFTGAITMHGKTKNTAIDFQIGSKPPPVVKKVSFQLTTVQLLNSKLKKATT